VAIVAASLSAAFAGSSFAAAATGSLPVALQSAVSGALGHVGISVPNPHAHGSGNSTGRGNAHGGTAGRSGPGGVAVGPDATSQALNGLCRAWLATPTTNAHSQKDNAVAFANLQKAAAKAGVSVAEYCKRVTAPGGTKTTTTPTTVSNGHTPNSGHGNGKTPSSVSHGNGHTPSSVAHGNGNTPSSVSHGNGHTPGHGPPTSKGNPGHGSGSKKTSTTTTGS